jgi:HlyD family secretion protein
MEDTSNHHANYIPEKTASRSLAIWGFVAVCIVGAVLSLKLLKTQRAPKPVGSVTPKPVVTVTVAKADYDQMQDQLEVTGTIRAVDPLTVGAETNGLKIESIEVEEGASVRKGQVLARLNSSILEAQLSQAQARYQGSLAQISKARQPNRVQDIQMLQSALAQAKANEAQDKANLRQAELGFQNAQRTADRYGKVLDEGFVTAQESQDRSAERDRTQQALNAAAKRLDASTYLVRQAEERLSLANAGGRSEDVSIAQSNSQEIAANIQLLQAQLEQTIIRAPEDGLVVQRDAHLGDIASPTKALFTIAKLGQLELRAQVPESDLQRVKEGGLATVEVGGQDVSGRVWMISPAVDPTTRLGQARILLNQSTHKFHRISPGMFARAKMGMGHHQALVIPSASVMGEGEQYYTFVLDGDHVKKVPVSVGARSGDKLEVTKGLSADQQVVVKGAGFVADGDMVTVAATQPSSEHSPAEIKP